LLFFFFVFWCVIVNLLNCPSPLSCRVFFPPFFSPFPSNIVFSACFFHVVPSWFQVTVVRFSHVLFSSSFKFFLFLFNSHPRRTDQFHHYYSLPPHDREKKYPMTKNHRGPRGLLLHTRKISNVNWNFFPSPLTYVCLSSFFSNVIPYSHPLFLFLSENPSPNLPLSFFLSLSSVVAYLGED